MLMASALEDGERLPTPQPVYPALLHRAGQDQARQFAQEVSV